MMAVCGNTLWLLGGVVEVCYHPLHVLVQLSDCPRQSVFSMAETA